MRKNLFLMFTFICASLFISCSVENQEEINVQKDLTSEELSAKKVKDDNSELFDYIDDYAEAFYNIEPYPPLTPKFPDLSADDAYAFQERLVKELKKGSRDRMGGVKRLTGYKLGFTADEKPFGAPQPIYGRIYSAFEVPEGTTLSLSEDFIRGSVGFEVAIIMGKHVKTAISPQEAMKAVEAIAPAYEFADFGFTSSNFNYKDIIATNSAARYYILGEKTALEDLIEQGINPNEIGVTGTLDGEVILEAEIGLPVDGIFSAVSFLSEQLASRGEFLKPGDIILSGAIKGNQLEGPGTYIGDYGILGQIEVTIVE